MNLNINKQPDNRTNHMRKWNDLNFGFVFTNVSDDSYDFEDIKYGGQGREIQILAHNEYNINHDYIRNYK